MKRYAIAILAGLLAGVLAMALARRQPPRPRLHSQVWQITDPGGKAVHPGQPLRLPNPRYGDFDLNCRIELPPSADLDLVFRKVELWDEGLEVSAFHGRFAALRMSSRKKGPGFLTREQLLFGPDVGGVQFSPGIPASLELACRGRVATALVNGVELGPFETVDEFGNLALVCRQGTAIVHDLTITPWPVPEDNTAWYAVVGVGGLLGILLAVTQAALLRGALALLLFAGGGALAGLLFDTMLLPLVRPTALAVGLGACSLAVAAACLSWTRGSAWVRIGLTLVLGAGAAGALLEAAARELRFGWSALEDPRLDLTFGPESGLAPFRALARLLKNEYAIHTVDPEKRTDVLLLGPARMFDAPGDPAQNISAMLPSLLGERLKIGPGGRRPRCVALAADLSCAQQQVWGVDRYYRDFRPKVVVLGLTSDEDDCHEIYGGAPRGLLAAVETNAEGRVAAPDGWILPQLLGGSATRPRTPQTTADLRATLQQVQEICREMGAILVLVRDSGLSPALTESLQAFAAAEKIPLVGGFAVDGGVAETDKLVGAVTRALVQ